MPCDMPCCCCTIWRLLHDCQRKARLSAAARLPIAIHSSQTMLQRSAASGSRRGAQAERFRLRRGDERAGQLVQHRCERTGDAECADDQSAAAGEPDQPTCLVELRTLALTHRPVATRAPPSSRPWRRARSATRRHGQRDSSSRQPNASGPDDAPTRPEPSPNATQRHRARRQRRWRLETADGKAMRPSTSIARSLQGDRAIQARSSTTQRTLSARR